MAGGNQNKTNFRTYDAQQRLIVAMLAAHPEFRPNMGEIQKHFGESTADGLGFQFRNLKTLAKQVRDGVAQGKNAKDIVAGKIGSGGGPSSPATRNPSGASTPAARRVRRQDDGGDTGPRSAGGSVPARRGKAKRKASELAAEISAGDETSTGSEFGDGGKPKKKGTPKRVKGSASSKKAQEAIMIDDDDYEDDDDDEEKMDDDVAEAALLKRLKGEHSNSGSGFDTGFKKTPAPVQRRLFPTEEQMKGHFRTQKRSNDSTTSHPVHTAQSFAPINSPPSTKHSGTHPLLKTEAQDLAYHLHEDQTLSGTKYKTSIFGDGSMVSQPSHALSREALDQIKQAQPACDPSVFPDVPWQQTTGGGGGGGGSFGFNPLVGPDDDFMFDEYIALDPPGTA
ncbi:hypothetical protein P8C59_004146 [Phyllachora maydis]|uniref:Uncharacterized protein n=1 Tax=Phyllachora maydis TaxID=1825666 RepID=A0AAD9MA36_9PEZI|nr:hypothetical protein P8C59_004146 [Phyllachora maydis]